MKSTTKVTAGLSAVDRRALGGCRLTFFSTGVLMGSWTATLPRLRGQLGLDSAQFGLVMLVFAVGGIAGLATAPRAMNRWGARATLRFGAGLVGAAAFAAGVFALAGHVGAVAVLVGVYGFGFAWIDVDMNLFGSRVEQSSGRSHLAGLNGMFSIGSVIGGLAGVGAVTWGTPPLVLLGVAILATVAGFAASAAVYPSRTLAGRPGPSTVLPRRMLRRPSFDRRIVGLGLVVFVFSASEHTAYNWLIVAGDELKHLDPTLATLMLTVFSGSAVLGRMTGDSLVDRLGRVMVVRLGAASAVIGVLLFVLGGLPAMAAGVAAWGFGASLGFPIAVSAAGDGDQASSDVRVSQVASFGYAAQFLVPPAVGIVGADSGLGPSFVAGACLVLLGLVVASATRPVQRRESVDLHPPRGMYS